MADELILCSLLQLLILNYVIHKTERRAETSAASLVLVAKLDGVENAVTDACRLCFEKLFLCARTLERISMFKTLAFLTELSAVEIFYAFLRINKGSTYAHFSVVNFYSCTFALIIMTKRRQYSKCSGMVPMGKCIHRSESRQPEVA